MLDSRVIGGFFLGGGLAYLFCALAIDAVSHSAVHIIDEVRRQFREIAGIWDGTAKPDYTRCVDIATGAALKNMLLPGSIAVVAPVVVGIVLGREALAGMLMGATLCGVLLALFMSNSGGAWDNAKKAIEEDGKGTESHKAAVIGDTVGDPLKDTAGPLAQHPHQADEHRGAAVCAHALTKRPAEPASPFLQSDGGALPAWGGRRCIRGRQPLIKGPPGSPAGRGASRAHRPRRRAFCAPPRPRPRGPCR